MHAIKNLTPWIINYHFSDYRTNKNHFYKLLRYTLLILILIEHFAIPFLSAIMQALNAFTYLSVMSIKACNKGNQLNRER